MERPQVQLVASSLPPAPQEPVAAPAVSRRVPLLVAAAGLLLALGAREQPPPPEPPPAELVVRSEALSITQGGVLVVALELRNPGERLGVRSAQVFASPVRTDPTLQAPQDVDAGDRRRFVATLAPDCGLLRATGAAFTAGVLLEVGRGSSDVQLALDLAGDPAVAARVRDLCA